MTGMFQEIVNTKITYWKSQYPEPIYGKTAIREFQDFAFDGEEVFSLSEICDTKYSPSRAKQFRHVLSGHRIHQLEQGAPITKNEMDLWAKMASDMSWQSEYVTFSRVTASDGTTAWFAITMNGFHLTATIIDAAGPFWTPQAAMVYGMTKVRSWHGWWSPTAKHVDGEAMCHEIETYSHKRQEGFHTLSTSETLQSA